MTTTTIKVKSELQARMILVALAPGAHQEKSKYVVLGNEEKQECLFKHEKSGLSYCKTYACDCETLESVTFFDDCGNVAATVEVDPDCVSDVGDAIAEIGRALGMEEFFPQGEKPPIIEFEVNSIYGLDGIFGRRFKVIAINGSFVTVMDENGRKFRRAVKIVDNAQVIQPYNDKKMYGELVDLTINAKHFIEKISPVDDSNAKLIACIDDYATDADAAAEVEIENAKNANAAEENAEVKKFEVGKWYYDCCISANQSPAYKVTHRTKKMVTLTDDFGEIIKRKIDATFSVEKVSFNGDIMPIFLQADCFCTNAEEIQKAEDALAYSLAADNGNITVEEPDPNVELIACIDDYIVNSDDAADVEEVNARNAVFEISKKRDAFIANVFSKCGKFSIKLARSDEDRNFHLDEDGLWTVRLTEKDVGYLNELYYYEEGGKFTLALMRGLADYNLAVYDTEEEVQKAIIAIGAAVKRGDKIFTFPAPRKSIIDWDAAYKEIRLAEIFSLQKEFKKLLKLGELERAENVFENIKLLFKAA